MASSDGKSLLRQAWELQFQLQLANNIFIIGSCHSNFMEEHFSHTTLLDPFFFGHLCTFLVDVSA